MKTAIYTIIFTLFSVSIISAQTSLGGKVLDAITGENILFGIVELYKKDVLITGVETDLDGKYIFSDIDPGTYDLQASYMGYTPQKYTNVIVKAGRANKVDFAITEGVLLGAVEIINYKTPLIEKDYTTSGAISTADKVKSLSTKSIVGMATSTFGAKSSKGSPVPIRGINSRRGVYYSGPIRKLEADISGRTSSIKIDLPKSGQMTAGEWNDLHNWKDWLELLEDESYSIMMERFVIRPTERFSVIVINQDNAVMANVPVKLLDNRDNIIWQTFTDNAGKAELWESAFIEGQIATSIKVGSQIKKDIVKIEDGSNTFVVQEDCSSPEKMDIVFTVDATSSMNDEISYLKSELLDVIQRIKATNTDIDFNLGSVFYRDTKDEYLTRVSPLSNTIEETTNFVQGQNSNGGGDHPEAVEAALEETLSLSWREDALKIVFLILDAPPHEDDATMEKIRSQIQEAASRGIKLIPVTASGIGRETEFLMKFMAILTNGTYVFITDDSGIGNAHLDPVVDDYEVEKLNDCLVRLITQYSKSYSCDTEVRNDNIEVNVYPNPSTQFINVKTNSVPVKIKIYSSNGMMIKAITPSEKETRIEMGDFVNGIYTISIFIGDKVESKQIILLK